MVNYIDQDLLYYHIYDIFLLNQRATDRYWEEMRLDIIEKQKYWGPILKDLKK